MKKVMKKGGESSQLPRKRGDSSEGNWEPEPQESGQAAGRDSWLVTS